MAEATRCLNCKNPRCVQACPVGVNIPSFIAKVKEGDIAGAAEIIAEKQFLACSMWRVCPQESQCEGSVLWELKTKQFLLESWNVLSQIGQERGA